MKQNKFCHKTQSSDGRWIHAPDIEYHFSYYTYKSPSFATTTIDMWPSITEALLVFALNPKS